MARLGGLRRSTRQTEMSVQSDKGESPISLCSDDAEDNTAVRAELSPASFEKFFAPQPRTQKRTGELLTHLESQHPLSDGKHFGDVACSTMMPAAFRAQKGQIVMVDCVAFDRKPIGFEQVSWMMNGDPCLLVETWKGDDEWVQGRRQLNSDKPGEFSGPIERWSAQSCCLCEDHVLRSGSQNHFFGYFNANADFPNPFMVSWTNMRRGIEDDKLVSAMDPSDQFLARLPGPICRFDIVRFVY